MSLRIIILFLLISLSCSKKNEDSLDKIKILVDNGNYEIAKNKLLVITQTNKKSSKAYNLLGVCFFELKELTDAENNFTNAIKIEQNYKYYYNRGNVRIELNELDNALKDYNKAISLNDKKGDIYNNRGNLFYRTKKYNMAIKDFIKFSELQPNNEKAYLYIAKSQFLVDDFQKAIINLKKAVEINSKYSEAFFWLGLANHQVNLKEEGCLILKKAENLGHPYAKDAIKVNCDA